MAEVALDRFKSDVPLQEFAIQPQKMWRLARPSNIRKGIGRSALRAEVRLPGSILEVIHTDRPPLRKAKKNPDSSIRSTLWTSSLAACNLNL